MKVIKLKASGLYDYFEKYVTLVIQPFYGINDTEVKILARIYEAINVELNNKVPLEAAIRLISSTEGRNIIKDKITTISKKFNNKEGDLSDVTLRKSLNRLRGKGLLSPKFAPLSKHLISPSDEGFGFNVIIEEDGNK